jgi:ZIP family zinc transporter
MALAYRSLINKRWTALIMAFGAGAIISAAAYQLILGAVSESQDKEWLVALGLAIGALTFYFADRWVDKMGGADRNDMDGAQSSGSGTGILLGSLLDGVPESLVLGLSLVHSPEISMAYIFAVAISNIPQGLGGTAGMLESGWPEKKITNLWLAVCGASIVAAALGYGLGAAFSGVTGALVDAFAGGALLVMLTDSLLPEAFKHGRKETGLSLVIGFGVAVALSTLQLS